MQEFGTKVAVTAATGIAATHISGTTLHSFAGCGIPQTMADFLKMNSTAAAARWRAVEVLLIDEVSMISAELFTAIERGARSVRSSAAPWGGVQLVVCGDFFQLPPIERRPAPGLPKDAFMNRGFAFQSPCWLRCDMQEVILTKVFRQADEEFVGILNDLREGRGQNALSVLQRRCMRPLPSSDGIIPTELYARNADVDAVNSNELARLDFELVEQQSQDSVTAAVELAVLDEQKQFDRATDAKRVQQEEALQRHEFFRDCLAAQRISLKMASQVMLLRNLELTGGASKMLVNGSRGVITHFLTREEARAKLLAEIKEVRPARLMLHCARTLRWAASQVKSGLGEQAASTLQRRLSNLDATNHAKVPVVSFMNGVRGAYSAAGIG